MAPGAERPTRQGESLAALRDWLNCVFAGRPAWMNALMVFCAFMAFVYVPWDFFVKPVAEDQEVWLGVMFTGAAAKFGEPLHWAIYAAGAHGFYRKSHWMWPWASMITPDPRLCTVRGARGCSPLRLPLARGNCAGFGSKRARA